MMGRIYCGGECGGLGLRLLAWSEYCKHVRVVWRCIQWRCILYIYIYIIHTCVQRSSLMTGFRISRIFKPSLLQWGEVSEFLGDANCLNVFEGHCSQTMVTCLDYWPLDKSKVWPLDTLLFVYSGKILSCQLYLCPLPGKYNIKQTFLSMSVLGIIPCWADQFSSPHE